MNMNLWKIKGDNSLIYKSSFWSNYCYNNSAGMNMISNDLLHNSYCYSTLHPKIHPQLHHLRCPRILACIHCCIYRWGVEISAANIFLVVSWGGDGVSRCSKDNSTIWAIMQEQQIWCYKFLPLGGFSQKINWRLSVPDLKISIFVLVLRHCIWYTQYDVRHVSHTCHTPNICVFS